MQPSAIKQLIESGLPDCTAIVDGDGRHFNAIVIADAFNNKNRIERQQMVYATLNNKIMDGSLHAISIKTYTLNEWKLREP